MARRHPDYKVLAQRQRWMIWLVLIGVISQCGPVFMGVLPGRGPIVLVAIIALYMAIVALLVVGTVLLLLAQGSHIAIVILCGFLMLAPCGNLLVLVVINSSVTRTLKRAGLRVGFFGVNPEEAERILNDALCSGCGYNLTGNVSGICSECGLEVPPPLAKPIV